MGRKKGKAPLPPMQQRVSRDVSSELRDVLYQGSLRDWRSAINQLIDEHGEDAELELDAGHDGITPSILLPYTMEQLRLRRIAELTVDVNMLGPNAVATRQKLLDQIQGIAAGRIEP